MYRHGMIGCQQPREGDLRHRSPHRFVLGSGYSRFAAMAKANILAVVPELGERYDLLPHCLSAARDADFAVRGL